MTADGIMKRPDAALVSCNGISGLLLYQRAGRGMRIALCSQLCCPRLLSLLRLANAVRTLTAHAMPLMTYPHPSPCTITHYPYFDSLYLHSITSTALFTRITHTHPTFPSPHVSAVGVVHCVRNWYWHCLSLLFARMSCTRCRNNASNTKRIFETRLGFTRDKNDGGGPTDKIGRSHEA
jgi:hypothetical protein